MSRIVVDADGLIKLGKSGTLAVLISTAEVLVPGAVYEEAVIAGKKEMYEDAFELERVLREGGAEVVKEERAERPSGGLLEDAPSLGAGERAALGVMYAREADAILTDDRAFLKVLEEAGIRTVVPVAVIVGLAEGAKISAEEATEALGRIRDCVRREVYEPAMEELTTLKEERG